MWGQGEFSILCGKILNWFLRAFLLLLLYFCHTWWKVRLKWNRYFASVNAINLSQLRGRTFICPLFLFPAGSFFTSDNSCACEKDVPSLCSAVNKLRTKWSHFPLPTPLQVCLSEALLRILSVHKWCELGSFCLLAWFSALPCSLAGLWIPCHGT